MLDIYTNNGLHINGSNNGKSKRSGMDTTRAIKNTGVRLFSWPFLSQSPSQ